METEVIKEGGRFHGQFTINKKYDDGTPEWSEVIQIRDYKAKDSALKGLASIRKNISNPKRITLEPPESGNPETTVLKLRSANGSQVLVHEIRLDRLEYVKAQLNGMVSES